MNTIGSDDALRAAVHDAVDPVTGSFDLLDRVRSGVARRRRRMQVAGSLGVGAMLAGGITFAVTRPGSPNDSAGGVALPDCVRAISPSTSISDLPLDAYKHLVPGTPVVAIACDVSTYPPHPGPIVGPGQTPTPHPTDSLVREEPLRGAELRAVIAALNSQTSPGENSEQYGHEPEDVVRIIFRYRSGPDVMVSVSLYSNTDTIENGGGMTAHFAPKPIPAVIRDLGSAS